jgi:uncharacterized protein (TIGR03435 family)
MRRALFVTLLTACALASIELVAQSPPPAGSSPSFDVASVKPNDSGSGASSGRTGRGSVTFVNQSGRMLIVNAYGLRPNRVIGGPSWLDSERFDVNARAPENTPDNQLALMLRTLLAERFKLAVKNETRDEPIYALVAARADKALGPNIRPATDCLKGGVLAGRAGGSLAAPLLQVGAQAPCGTRSASDSRGTVIQAGARTMADLANTLRGVGGREVVDRTGLTGTFDFELRYAPDSVRATADDPTQTLPDVFTALQEQLGLRLESQRGPVEYLVVDRVERPTPD